MENHLLLTLIIVERHFSILKYIPSTVNIYVDDGTNPKSYTE